MIKTNKARKVIYVMGEMYWTFITDIDTSKCKCLQNIICFLKSTFLAHIIKVS